jgi:S-adenosylmethionine:tRNA ribosyltransferase-isomerase
VSPARAPRAERDRARLLILDPRSGDLHDGELLDLPGLLGPGDVLVVNDAATLPASLGAELVATSPGQRAASQDEATIELRLAGIDPEDEEGERWRAVVFGRGDWRTRTEERAAPPPITVGDVLAIAAAALRATIVAVSAESPRLVTLAFDRRGAELWSALYRAGRPVQYSHLEEALELWSVQTSYASRPWAVEAPSAGLGLSWRLLGALRARGVVVATLTHGAGLSATGDPELDAALPLPERYDIPAATVAAIDHARANGRRVIAVGTTVVRALEASARAHGVLRAGTGVAELKLSARHRLVAVDGLLTGIHDPSESHFALLGAFAPRALLLAAWHHAARAGYLGHEFGDVMLVAAPPAEQPADHHHHPHQGTALQSRNKPPLGPSSRSVASHTAVSAVCSNASLAWLRDGSTEGHTALTLIPSPASSRPSARVSARMPDAPRSTESPRGSPSPSSDSPRAFDTRTMRP